MKNYDKRVKGTRILLADYLILREYAQRAGVSMAEALHTIIVNQAPETITIPRTRIPVTVIEAKPKLVNRPILPKPAISVNGDKHVSIAIKSKGGITNG